ncbi:MAG: hypothetical protein ACPGXK_02400, partial [Phycisphaerae bacterium]
MATPDPNQPILRPNTDTQAEFLWVAEGQRKQAMVAEVAVALPYRDTAAYMVPEAFENQILLGHRVTVPIGKKGNPAVGFVVQLDQRPWDSSINEIVEVVDRTSYLTPDLIQLGREIASHYRCSLGIALKAMTPEAVRRETGYRQAEFISLAIPPEETKHARLGKKQQAIVSRLQEATDPIEAGELLKQADAARAT